jgi:hypothetical protein
MEISALAGAVEQRGCGRHRAAILVVIACALYLAHANAAFGSTASVNGSTLQYTSSPGESNFVTIDHTFGLAFTIKDAGAIIVAGSSCVAIDAHDVSCSDSGVVSTLIDVGDQNDVVVGTGGFGAADHLIGGQEMTRLIATSATTATSSTGTRAMTHCWGRRLPIR